MNNLITLLDFINMDFKMCEKCEICKVEAFKYTYRADNPSKEYHRELPRIRSETLRICSKCSLIFTHDRRKYDVHDFYTRTALGKYNPFPRRSRLIYKELHFHKDIDKIILEYSC